MSPYPRSQPFHHSSGCSASEARAIASAASTATTLREEEKECTSWILLALTERPDAAPMLSTLATRCGSALADYLLQQCEWVLQDPNTTTGRHTLAFVMQGRCGGTSQGTPAPFALEQGLCKVVLLGLVANTAARRRDVAQQVVSQLGTIVAMLRAVGREGSEGSVEGNVEADHAVEAEAGKRAVGLGAGRLRRAAAAQALHAPGADLPLWVA